MRRVGEAYFRLLRCCERARAPTAAAAAFACLASVLQLANLADNAFLIRGLKGRVPRRNDQSFLELERNTIKEQNFSENFFEIAPLNEEFDIKNRKELSSQKISEFNFPKIVYMVVSNNIEIYSRPLKDYPN